LIAFISKRLAYGFLVMVLVVITITSIIYLAPVDPTRLTFGQRSDAATVEAKQKELGLDQALPVQLYRYLVDLSPINWIDSNNDKLDTYSHFTLYQGDKSLIIKWPWLRESYQTGRPVIDIMKEAIPKTALLALCAILIATFLGLILGVIAAVKKNTKIDSLIVMLSVFGYSLPSYVTAIILAVLFGFLLNAYTGLNIQGSIVELNDIGDEVFVWKNLLLPSLALGLRPIAIITQLTRSAMLDVMSQPYIRTAKAKGLSYYTVLFKHALRNALNPVVTAVSGWFAALLAGAFFVENVFNFKGLGDITVNALLNFDIPVVLAAVLFTALVFIIINIIVDLLYVLIDPRIKFDS